MASQGVYEPSQATQPGDREALPDEDFQANSHWGRLLLFESNKTIDLQDDKPFVIGRFERNQLVVSHPQVSNKHCNIKRVREPTGCVIEDTSSNGTFLNGRRLLKGSLTQLTHKSLITLVSTRPKREHLNLSFVFFDLINGKEQPNQSAKGTDVIGSFYITEDVLGNGSFAQVKLGINMKTGDQVAVKIVLKRRFKEETKTKQNLLSEIIMLQQLEHPNIVNIFDVEDTVHCVYIFLELGPDGDLFHLIKRTGAMDVARAKVYFKQILFAVDYLHKQNIIHRDLKLENVVLQPRLKYHLVKITDFGLAKLIGEAPFVRTICGTPNYIAPEILSSKAYNQKADCWSLGVILFTMLTASMPFDDKDEPTLFRKISKAEFVYDPNDWKDIENGVQDLINNLIKLDVNTRFTVKQALEHPWMQDPEVDEIIQSIVDVDIAEAPMPKKNSSANSIETIPPDNEGNDPGSSSGHKDKRKSEDTISNGKPAKHPREQTPVNDSIPTPEQLVVDNTWLTKET